MKQAKKNWYIALGSVAALAAVFVVLQATHVTHFFTPVAERQKQQETEYNNQRKENAINHGGNVNASPNASDTPYTPPSSPDAITITPSRNGNSVTLVTKLAGYSDGTCKLTITNGAKSMSQGVNIIYAPEFATCAGFSIPVSQLGVGLWSISLDVTSGGVATHKTLSYEVQ